MVNQPAVRSRDGVSFESRSDLERKIGQLLPSRKTEILSVVTDQKEPVSSPRDVTGDCAMAGNIHGDSLAISP